MVSIAQSGKATVKGKIDGIKDGTLYLLARSCEEKVDTLVSCKIKKGKFKLKSTIGEPMLVQLVVGGFSGG
ncbi:MAG: DUF4369 domain-containing protein, partial [Bacteroidaceae bacterium]|nr:DUF4369 domain-containing protein [Bacteroidaceae bacterium]